MPRKKKELTPRELLEQEFPCCSGSITIHKSGKYDQESLYVPYLDRKEPDNIFSKVVDGHNLKHKAYNITAADRKIFPELKYRQRIVLYEFKGTVRES